MRHLAWIALTLLALPTAAAAAVYKCTDATGRSIYQDRACDGASQGATLRAGGGDATSATPPADAGAAHTDATAGSAATTGGAANPAEAWENLLSAMRSGSIDQAIACFLPSARKSYEEAFRQIGPAGLRETAAQMGEFALKPGARGELAYGEVVRTPREGEPKSFQVAFAREPSSGKWFVKSM